MFNPSLESYLTGDSEAQEIIGSLYDLRDTAMRASEDQDEIPQLTTLCGYVVESLVNFMTSSLVGNLREALKQLPEENKEVTGADSLEALAVVLKRMAETQRLRLSDHAA